MMRKILTAAGAVAALGTGVAGAGLNSASAATTPVAHVCTNATSRTYQGVTYYEPYYGTAGDGVPGICTIAYGTTNTTTVSAMQRGINVYFQQHGIKTVLPVTGYYGPQTQAALRTLQKDAGLPVTGNFDLGTSSILQEPFTW